MAFAAAGKQVQALFQQPWIIVLFAALFVAMALSMFGLFTVQMPAAIQTRLAAASNRQRGGNFGGVAVMGALSALIVTTCVAPPLVATLVVIGQSGPSCAAAAALFAMSLGWAHRCWWSAAPLAAGCRKAGAWMDGVKRLFGVMMLALAAWMLTRIVPARATLLLFVVPALAAASCSGELARTRSARSSARAPARRARSAAAYGVGAAGRARPGAEDPLQPLIPAAHAPADAGLPAASPRSRSCDREVQGGRRGQPVMLDFYADWCTSCKEMQRYTFTDPAVRAGAANRCGCCAPTSPRTTPRIRRCCIEFQIFGPPTIAFYDPQGRSSARIAWSAT